KRGLRLQDQLRKARLERGRAAIGDADAIVAPGKALRDFAEELPSRRDLADVLVAIREVENGAERRIEVVALLELGAGRREVALVGRRSTRAKKSFARRRITLREHRRREEQRYT